jgi:hypothetical protein
MPFVRMASWRGWEARVLGVVLVAQVLVSALGILPLAGQATPMAGLGFWLVAAVLVALAVSAWRLFELHPNEADWRRSWACEWLVLLGAVVELPRVLPIVLAVSAVVGLGMLGHHHFAVAQAQAT